MVFSAPDKLAKLSKALNNEKRDNTSVHYATSWQLGALLKKNVVYAIFLSGGATSPNERMLERYIERTYTYKAKESNLRRIYVAIVETGCTILLEETNVSCRSPDRLTGEYMEALETDRLEESFASMPSDAIRERCVLRLAIWYVRAVGVVFCVLVLMCVPPVHCS